MYCPESLALFFDELATVFTLGYSSRPFTLDRPFIIYLTEHFTFHFQNHFVAESLPEKNL